MDKLLGLSLLLQNNRKARIKTNLPIILLRIKGIVLWKLKN